MTVQQETRRLLIIDDDRLILQCMQLALPAPEYQVLTASSAKDGLEKFASWQPDAVLLDIQLPDRSGLEVLQEMRNQDLRVPIILMTGHGTAETVITSISGGDFQYITKPFDPDEVLPVIDSALETSRMAQTGDLAGRIAGGNDQRQRRPDSGQLPSDGRSLSIHRSRGLTRRCRIDFR